MLLARNTDDVMGKKNVWKFIDLVLSVINEQLLVEDERNGQGDLSLIGKFALQYSIVLNFACRPC